jgi:glucosamine--fructose-6-phosphate aminotransferase (isomerizing)
MAALAATAVTIWSSDNIAQNRRTQCSGILGVVGNSGGTSQGFFLQGLTVLKNQGLDGVGIATIDESKKGIVISKHVVVDDEKTNKTAIKADDPILRFVESHYSTHYPNHNLYTGMAHTRWASQGGKTQESNVHPHLDSTGKIALIHNGTLTNAKELRNELIAKGHVFEGQTDSEVIAKLVGHYYAKGGRSVKEATERALKRCDGTWGLCILCSDNPDEMVVACNGSSLYIGLGDDRIYVSSELSIFHRYTKNHIVMNDGEIGVLHADGRTLDLSRRKSKEFFEDEVAALPTPYDHWTLKEIMDQPEAAGRALGFGGRLSWEKVCLGGLDQNSKKLEKIQHLALGGCGSSFNAAKYGERIMKHLASVPGRITSIDMVEAEYLDLACPKDNSSTGLIAISQSGETSDVKSFVETAMSEGTTTVGVVNVVGSMIARATKMGVYCHSGQESGVVSTKSFTAQVTILALVALWFRELRDQMEGTGRPSIETERLKEALLRLPISLGMALKTRNQCKGIAERLKKKEHCFVLGKGEKRGWNLRMRNQGAS